LMVPVMLSMVATPIENTLNNLSVAPANPDFPFLVMLWFSNWDWLLLVIPVILIPLLFPTGRPSSARWRWVLIFLAALCITFLFFTTFSESKAPPNGNWQVPNPIGFVDDAIIQTLIVPWQIGLILTVIACVASLFVRYRHAEVVERKQIKWLLYACGIFALIYIPGFLINDSDTTSSFTFNFFNVLFNLAIIAFPTSIAIAILNYRLWDIDFLIRRTLIYAVLTASLALFYLGSILLLQQLFRFIIGDSSQVSIVISTLAIAALFAPLRRRVQDFIDLRFFRQKYNVALALEEFSAAARREVELENLTTRLLGVVNKTVQPEEVSVWIRNVKKET
jgi:hypothetical protein